ncbi:hypothetical protein LJK88_32970 [Paenibacillus sp. P26]|nr:hypothetical protein LJK88_32970 [Paenibacillus sp. P26]
MNLNQKLSELHRKGGLIRVGLVGAGQMGRGMISQIESMKGMRVVATADVRTDNAKNAYLFAGVARTPLLKPATWRRRSAQSSSVRSL